MGGGGHGWRKSGGAADGDQAVLVREVRDE